MKRLNRFPDYAGNRVTLIFAEPFKAHCFGKVLFLLFERKELTFFEEEAPWVFLTFSRVSSGTAATPFLPDDIAANWVKFGAQFKVAIVCKISINRHLSFYLYISISYKAVGNVERFLASKSKKNKKYFLRRNALKNNMYSQTIPRFQP